MRLEGSTVGYQVKPPNIMEKKFEQQKFVSTTKEIASHPVYLEMGILSAYWDPMNSSCIFSTLVSLAGTDPLTYCSKNVYKMIFNKKLK